jgi:hypothetical protein
MMSSYAALKSFALESVVAGDIYAGSESAIQGGTTSFTISSVSPVSKIQDIARKVSGLTLSVSVANPNDPLGIGGILWDINGNVLFYANNQVTLVKTGDSWGISTDDRVINFELSSSIPIPTKDVSQVRVVVRDKDGVATGSTNLGVYNQGTLIQFPTSYAGKNGEMMVTFTDGSTTVWNLKGDVVKVVSVPLSVVSNIRGYEVVKNPENFSPRISSNEVSRVFELSAVFPVQFNVSSAVAFDVNFPVDNIEAAIGFFIRKVGTKDWVYYSLPSYGLSIKITAQPGTYHIVYKFPTLIDPMDAMSPVIDNGGGKG